jgi:hypothetical protein
MKRWRVASVRPTIPDLLAQTESRTLETQSPWNPVRLTLICITPRTALADASSQTDLALLNQERAAWGLPAGITENPTWSADCALHDEYERLNGGTLTHVEIPGNPGYTAGGAYAGQNSILSEGSAWTAFNNPFETAPIHLDQLFTPSLAQVGIDDSAGYVCVTTFPGLDGPTPAAETVTTYPGNGTTGFITSEDADESPFVPGTFVGIPLGTTAGREIFVYLDEPGEPGPAPVSIEAASLTSPSGPLAIQSVDNNTPTLGPYLTGGIIIPVQPLPQGVTIDASVTVAGAAGPVTHQWSFMTALDPNATVTVKSENLTFKSQNPASGQLSIFVPPSPGKQFYAYNLPIKSGTTVLSSSKYPSDTPLEACVSQPAYDGYDPAETCSAPFRLGTSATPAAPIHRRSKLLPWSLHVSRVTQSHGRVSLTVQYRKGAGSIGIRAGTGNQLVTLHTTALHAGPRTMEVRFTGQLHADNWTLTFRFHRSRGFRSMATRYKVITVRR